VRVAATFTVLLFLGFVASTAVAGPSPAPALAIPVPLLPTITTTLPVSTPLPKVTTTLPAVTTTLPKVTTTLPAVTTTLPKVTTTLPKVTTTLPKVTTTLPKVTTTPPKVTTTLPNVTTTPKITTVVPRTAPTSLTTAPNSANSTRLGTIPSLQSGTSGGNGSAASGSAAASMFTASSGGSTASPPTVTHLRSSQPFLVLHGPKARRSSILVFRLRHGGRVRFTVVEVFPLCQVVGHFTVRGHAGINRFRFNGRVRGKPLPSGTYQIGLRVRRGRLLRVTIAIFDSAISSPSLVAAAKKRNVCGATTSFSSSLGFDLGGVEGRSAAAESPSSPVSHHVLGVDVTGLAPQKLLTEIAKSPLGIVALGLAVLLFGLAMIPEAATSGPRTADLLARRRSAMILAGGVAFATGVIILTLS
jgi:hypothetical protein